MGVCLKDLVRPGLTFPAMIPPNILTSRSWNLQIFDKLTESTVHDAAKELRENISICGGRARNTISCLKEVFYTVYMAAGGEGVHASG